MPPRHARFDGAVAEQQNLHIPVVFSECCGAMTGEGEQNQSEMTEWQVKIPERLNPRDYPLSSGIGR